MASFSTSSARDGIFDPLRHGMLSSTCFASGYYFRTVSPRDDILDQFYSGTTFFDPFCHQMLVSSHFSLRRHFRLFRPKILFSTIFAPVCLFSPFHQEHIFGCFHSGTSFFSICLGTSFRLFLSSDISFDLFRWGRHFWHASPRDIIFDSFRSEMLFSRHFTSKCYFRPITPQDVMFDYFWFAPKHPFDYFHLGRHFRSGHHFQLVML